MTGSQQAPLRERLGPVALSLIVIAGTLLVLLAFVEVKAIESHNGIGSDFTSTIYRPAQAVIHRRSPYGDPRVPGPLAGSVYPPSAFVPVAWFALLPRTVAVAAWLVLLETAAVLTLWILGIRDPLLYGLWLLTPMVLATAALGNATVLIVLLVAVLWCPRDSPAAAAAALTAAIAIKLFVAPLLFWLLRERRYRGAAHTAIATPVVILAAWAAVGFSALDRYASILSANRDALGRDGPYLQQLVLKSGGSSRLALGAGIAAAAALLLGAFRATDLGAFTLTVTASIVLAPVAWIGYLALLVVPVAALWKRFSAAWCLLVVGTYAHWYYAPGFPSRTARLSVLTLALLVTIVALVLAKERRQKSAAANAVRLA